jgi:VWFA-related protein
MRTIRGRSPLTLFLLPICLVAAGTAARGQKPAPTKPSAPADDVIRVKTELVQTDVTVVDKHGRFINGLKPDQFELRVDAEPQSLTFFEEIITGSREEEKQLTSARGGNTALAASNEKDVGVKSNRGQLIFFFVDDVHLGGEGLSRAQSLLLNFLDNKMKDNDRVAIVSTSGQIGFLQQLTDNKAVLREAISRLNVRYNPETTASRVVISEVDANMVANHADRGLFGYLVAETMREFQMQPINAMLLVKNRVRQINAQAKTAELTTLYRLESLIRSTGPLAGRKVIFLISDGFVVDIKRSNGAEVVQRIGNQAARVGAVIYGLDTRATFFGPGADVTRNEFPDMSGGTAWRSIAESKAPQEPLETLADETGGRSYLNANALNDGVSQALAENSGYYLLGWRPDTEQQRAGKSRIDVTIKNRSDLRVKTRRHFFDLKTDQPAKPAVTATKSPDDELRTALGSLYPRRDLPTSVSARITNSDKGAMLNVSMEIDAEMVSFDTAAGKEQAVVDVLGVAIDDRGSFSSFKQRLDIPKEAMASGRLVKWNQSLQLPSGLYQVRVAVRDRQSARTGSAMVWIEIPSGEITRIPR